MSLQDMRQPPRFVPTLTDVVAEPQDVVTAQCAAVDPVKRELPLSSDAMLHSSSSFEEQAVAVKAAAVFERSMLAQNLQSKVMQQLEVRLQEHLHHAFSAVLQQHTQSLYQAIHTDIEQIVKACVQDALAAEDTMLEKLNQVRLDASN